MKRPQKLAVMLVPTPPYEICGLAALDGIASLEMREQIRPPLVGALTVMDLPAAVEYIESLPEDEASPELWEQVFEICGTYGFEGSSELFWKAIDRLPVDKQGKYLETQLRDLAISQPTEAMAKLAALPEHPDYLSLVSDVAAAMRTSDPDGAKAWIGTLEVEARGRAARSFAAGGPSSSVPEMFEWLQSLGISDEHMTVATGWIVPRWAAENGMAASAFVLDLEPGPVRQKAVVGLVGAWERSRNLTMPLCSDLLIFQAS